MEQKLPATPKSQHDNFLNKTYPEFSECLQNTLLLWIPAGLLWASLPFYIYHQTAKHNKIPIQHNCLNISKTIISVLLSLLAIANMMRLGVTADEPEEERTSAFIGNAVKLVTFLMTIVYIQLFRIRGSVTSCLLFIFWLLVLFVGIINSYSVMIKQVYKTDIYTAISTCICSLLVLLQFILHCFAEKPKVFTIDDSKKPCPEPYSSFPSRLTFWWANSLILRGFKKSLEEEDIWDLRPQEKSESTASEFEITLKHEITICERYNKQHFICSKIHREKSLEINDRQDTEISPLNQQESIEQETEMSPLNQQESIHQETEMSPFNQQKSTEQETEMSLLNQPESEEKYENNKGEDKRKIPSLLKIILKTYYIDMFKGLCSLTLFDISEFVNPILLGLLISYIENKDSEPRWKGYCLASLFYVNAIFLHAVSCYNDTTMRVNGLKLKSSLISAVYKKALIMDNEAKKKSTVGEIVNLISVDCDRMEELTYNLLYCLSVPFRISIGLILLWNIFGTTVLAGVSVIVVLFPLNMFLFHYNRKLHRELMEHRDKRCKIIGEAINGIKVIKSYAWEPSFKKKISEIRNKELSVGRKSLIVDACYAFSYGLVPFLVGLMSFVIYIFTEDGNSLTPEKAFVALSLIENLQLQMFALPYIITYITQASVSMKRVSKFLAGGEIDPERVKQKDNAGIAVSVKKGTFAWGNTLPPTLKNINIEIPKGYLTVVVGRVGAGKSSLLSALLGDMDALDGEVIVNGSVGYVPQIAWIQNESVRENILFGKEFKPSYYQTLVKSCCLEPDLAMFPAGDLTEIGEKGINLSGGQKQRVNLARAVYHNADIYLLDDPLSAVDSHVGKSIFNDVIGENGLLQNKTRIFVTHGVRWLPKADYIIVMTDGAVSEMGTYNELLSHNGPFSEFIRTYLLEHTDEVDKDNDEEALTMKTTLIQRLNSLSSGEVNETVKIKDYGYKVQPEDTNCNLKERKRGNSLCDDNSMVAVKEISTPVQSSKCDEKNGKITQEEEVEDGKVHISIYLKYLRKFGIFGFIVSLIFLLLEESSSAGGCILLSKWTEDPTLIDIQRHNTTEYRSKNTFYIGLYTGFGILKTTLDMLNAFAIYRGTLKVSSSLHGEMVDTVLRLPMSFFDITPSGRILNRFSSDVDKMDKKFPTILRMATYRIVQLIMTSLIICIYTPIFLAVIIPVAVFYILIQRYYIPTCTQLERLESKTLSPVYSYLGETIQGSSTIRAYRQQKRFIEESQRRTDANIALKYYVLIAEEWVLIRLEYIGAIFVLAAALFAVMYDDISGGVAGLCVTFAIQLTIALRDLVKYISMLETSAVSIERITEYIGLKTEASWINDSNRPDKEWPDKGNISIQNYKTKYRQELDLVLKGITCDIKGGEKVGIVGRTGAGKSSLTSSLFRLIESVDGGIFIDGVNISEIGLHDLRCKLTILPQDPVLFSGSLRSNLDPFDSYTDDEIWTVLSHAHLKSFINCAKEDLQFKCGEGGENLSVGQRQLVCLARALLHKTKILILDEATAAVDMETDDLIQETIRREFKECTVLTVAHRINTVLDYDKIMVLDKGLLVEFDSPKTLLSDQQSMFYKMAKAASAV